MHGRTEDPTHRQMALQCPQGPWARRQTRPNMCTAVMADPTTFPCHGEGELPGRPAANLRPLSPHGMMHHAAGGTHSRIKWPWLVVGDPGASTRPLITRGTPRSIATHPKTPRSQVANLAEIKPKSGAREWSRVWCAAMEDPTHRQMALQRPQGPWARRQTRPNMCTAAMADPTTFPCHGEGELPGRPVSQSQVTEPCTVRCTFRWERPTARLQRPP